MVFEKNDNYLKIRLLTKIRLLGRNSKIRSDENLPGCIEVLHAEFHDAPTSNEKDLRSRTNRQADRQTNRQVCAGNYPLHHTGFTGGVCSMQHKYGLV